MKINKPKLSDYLDNKNLNECIKEGEIKDGIFEQTDLYRDIKSCILDGCVFHNIDFTDVELEDVDIYDCIFDHCDLSNQSFEGKMLGRVQFKGCRLIGTNFIKSTLKDIVIEDSICEYINFSRVEMNKVGIYRSNCSNSFFMDCNSKNIEFDFDDFYQSEFSSIRLTGVDLSNCELIACRFDYYSIKGITINKYQCEDFMGMLGINVKE